MVDPRTVRGAYDDLAATYAGERLEHGPDVDLLVRFLDQLPKPVCVLDAGCGPRSPVLSASSRWETAVGLDFARGQLRLAAENGPGGSLIQGDLSDLPFRDGTFDAVVAYWSLIHVPLEDHQTALHESARVLRPNGRLLVSEGTNGWSGTNPDWLDGGVEMQWDIAGAEATRRQLRTAGFEIVDEWEVPDTLDGDDASLDAGDDLPWVIFSARLDT